MTTPRLTLAAAIMVMSAGPLAAQPITTQPLGLVDLPAHAKASSDPGLLVSWALGRQLWTTGGTELTGDALETRPGEWQQVARIDDMVTAGTALAGYVVDVGGFLNIGGRQALLPADRVHVVRAGTETLFVTDLSQDEIAALPVFDTVTVLK